VYPLLGPSFRTPDSTRDGACCCAGAIGIHSPHHHLGDSDIRDLRGENQPRHDARGIVKGEPDVHSLAHLEDAVEHPVIVIEFIAPGKGLTNSISQSALGWDLRKAYLQRLPDITCGKGGGYNSREVHSSVDAVSGVT